MLGLQLLVQVQDARGDQGTSPAFRCDEMRASLVLAGAALLYVARISAALSSSYDMSPGLMNTLCNLHIVVRATTMCNQGPFNRITPFHVSKFAPDRQDHDHQFLSRAAGRSL